MFTKYKYWSSTHFFKKKYLSTSSTFISSTSTSTHNKICSKVMMDIQSRVNFGSTKQRAFPKSCLCSIVKMSIYSMQSRFWMDKIKCLPQIMSLFKSQDGHILCRVNLEWTKYRGIISWSGYMIIWHQNIFSHHPKR